MPKAIHRLSRWSWPSRFAIVQFPNAPLLTALVASIVGHATHGSAYRLALAIFYLALGVWAYEEALHGDNWFRRLLGLAIGAYLVVRLAHDLRA